MYMTVVIYTDWIWTCWVWFRALWCNCTADSVIKWFVCCLHHSVNDCIADLIIEWFIHCCFYYNACWSVLTCDCTVAAEGTDCETDDLNAFL